ncbi:alpha/beta hydrolase [Psychrobium sp. MM17-31]|uniref:alpha/beta hydrolase family protein n=1 Tax=Psychrobium sp. MM17-31 TaxID=2917758 RepID=UPI001EF645C1|nr:alpha/beta fold hydrolase [Psychrobium sp. MM17-31]MCG7529863.1 alpha/beta hydrolase [Psychrobium sp. MM17-31]
MDAKVSIELKDIRIESPQAKHLAATIYAPQQLVGAVLIGPATGIKRQFYDNFAKYLAGLGYGVLTFDNEGIGGSLHGTLKACDASLVSWGKHDLSLALTALQEHFPDTQYHLVGHSAGGQLVGLMPNAHELNSVFNVACSSGQLRNMRMSYQLKAQYFMNFYIPLSNLLFGLTHCDWVGMGEKLPKHVARQWRHWCNGQGYVKTAFGDEVTNHHYDELGLPMFWINAVDDDIANNANVDDMVSVFSKVKARKLTLDPREHQLKEIGHMKFFSRKSNSLWPMAIEWFEEHSR